MREIPHISRFVGATTRWVRAENLVGMSKHDCALESNVKCAPYEKWIVFRVHFDGSPQVNAMEAAQQGRSEE